MKWFFNPSVLLFISSIFATLRKMLKLNGKCLYFEYISQKRHIIPLCYNLSREEYFLEVYRRANMLSLYYNRSNLIKDETCDDSAQVFQASSAFRKSSSDSCNKLIKCARSNPDSCMYFRM